MKNNKKVAHRIVNSKATVSNARNEEAFKKHQKTLDMMSHFPRPLDPSSKRFFTGYALDSFAHSSLPEAHFDIYKNPNPPTRREQMTLMTFLSNPESKQVKKHSCARTGPEASVFSGKALEALNS